MFNLHKCRCDKIQEVKVYNTKEVQDLYKKVFHASNEMDFIKSLNMNERQFIKHTSDFTIKMKENNFSLYLIPVTIHNQTYHFIVDTGAQISGIVSKHKELIKQYQTDTKIPVKSAGGSQKSLTSICIDQMFIGSLEILNQPFVVMDENDFKISIINKELMHFDGIIGWDVLSQIDFEMDTKQGLFSMINSEDRFTYCNLIAAVFPVIITYDEKRNPAIFGIDTGAKISWINDKYAIEHGLKVVREARGFNIGVHGLEKMKIKLIKECIVSFFESKITLSNLRSGQTQVFVNLHLDGIFGNEIFKKKKVQFLNSKGIIRII